MIHAPGNYAPIGPLSYLLLTGNGEMVLGIFESTKDKQLVFLFHHDSDYFVIKASEDQMEAVMKNMISLGELAAGLPEQSVTDPMDNPITSTEQKKLLVELLDKKLGETERFIVHPNYYYTYRQFVWEKKNTKTLQ